MSAEQGPERWRATVTDSQTGAALGTFEVSAPSMTVASERARAQAMKGVPDTPEARNLHRRLQVSLAHLGPAAKEAPGRHRRLDRKQARRTETHGPGGTVW